jgi:multiple sugar transport system substrate-binding protein
MIDRPDNRVRPPSLRNLRLTRRQAVVLPLAGGIVLTRSNRSSAKELEGTIRVGYEGTQTAVEPFIHEAAALIEEQYPNARVELEPSPGGNYATQLVLQLNAGRAPDLFLLLGLGLAELANAGYLKPLDENVASWNAWELYPASIKEAVTYEGSVWAIPYLVDTHFLYYRKDLFEQAGLDREWNPTSPDEILAVARQLKESNDSIIPFALYAGANGGNGTVARGFVPLLYAFGGALQDEQDRWIIDSCAIRQTLAYYEQAYQVDQTVPQEVMTSAAPSGAMRDAMAAGELGILYEGSWVYGDWRAEDAEVTDEEIGFALFPTADDRNPFAVGGIGTCWFIDSQSQAPDLAWAFIEAFNSAETQVELNVTDPHIPARSDAAADPAFRETPFLQAMVDSIDSLLLAEPDPSFRQLVGIIQNATGLVATGEATHDEAAKRYADEFIRVLDEENVVAESCP